MRPDSNTTGTRVTRWSILYCSRRIDTRGRASPQLTRCRLPVPSLTTMILPALWYIRWELVASRSTSLPAGLAWRLDASAASPPCNLSQFDLGAHPASPVEPPRRQRRWDGLRRLGPSGSPIVPRRKGSVHADRSTKRANSHKNHSVGGNGLSGDPFCPGGNRVLVTQIRQLVTERVDDLGPLDFESVSTTFSPR